MKQVNWKLTKDINETHAWTQMFSAEECEFILEIGKDLTLKQGVIDDDKLDLTTRKSNIAWIPVEEYTQWIFQRCTDKVLEMNSLFFNFDLYEIESLQFTSYDGDGSFYGKHIDMMYENGGGNTRKLTFSIQLCQSNDYDGGDLLLHHKDKPSEARRDIGIATFFPSYTLHEVTPVTRGTRYSLVGWVVGPKFK